MATYVLPQVLVFQDFQASPAAVANPLRAHISGAHNFIIRFSDDDERELGELDFYDDPVVLVIDVAFTLQCNLTTRFQFDPCRFLVFARDAAHQTQGNFVTQSGLCTARDHFSAG